AINAPTSSSINPAPYVGPYRLLAKFPSSSAGEVFLGVRRTEFGYARRAAIKVVWRHRTGYEELRRALLDEARAVAGLDHPNIVKMLDAGGGDYGAYIALEFVDGVDLQRVITILQQRQKRLPMSLAMFIVIETLRGLEHAHQASDASGRPLNLVHRDANPSNILVARSGHAVLTDFGIVRMRDRYQPNTSPDLVKGKFRYLAPEYITSREVDHRVDVYSMGVVLFECLSGGPWTELRSTHAMRKIVNEGLPVDRLNALGVPPPVVELVRRAVSRDPAERYQSAAQMAESLESYLSWEGIFVSSARLAEFLRPQGIFESVNTGV
ncbi:MAG: serine/threonine-protein kinase, partial [Myxococcota bacterium]